MRREFRSDIAFTPAVKAEQELRGSRAGYRKTAERRDWHGTVTDDLRVFLSERNSLYLGTATKDGQPYIQHRGGPRGFLKVIDDKTLGFADFSGNRQYISIGNAAENDKAYIFLMDYENRRRVKIWGRVRVVEADEALLRKVASSRYKARPERVILFEIEAWDTNCPQHIPQKFELETVEAATAQLTSRIAELEAELARFREVPG